LHHRGVVARHWGRMRAFRPHVKPGLPISVLFRKGRPRTNCLLCAPFSLIQHRNPIPLWGTQQLAHRLVLSRYTFYKFIFLWFAVPFGQIDKRKQTLGRFRLHFQTKFWLVDLQKASRSFTFLCRRWPKVMVIWMIWIYGR
jgi:hypothetical protein